MPSNMCGQVQAKDSNQMSQSIQAEIGQHPTGFLTGQRLKQTEIALGQLAAQPPNPLVTSADTTSATPFLGNLFRVDFEECTLRPLGPGTKTNTLGVQHRRRTDGAMEVVFTKETGEVTTNSHASMAVQFTALGLAVVCLAAIGWLFHVRYIWLPMHGAAKPPRRPPPVHRNERVLTEAQASVRHLGADAVVEPRPLSFASRATQALSRST